MSQWTTSNSAYGAHCNSRPNNAAPTNAAAAQRPAVQGGHQLRSGRNTADPPPPAPDGDEDEGAARAGPTPEKVRQLSSGDDRQKFLAVLQKVKPELVAQVTAGNAVPVFGYGSNNVEQLRARLETQELVPLAAVLLDYVRVFGGPNQSWSAGGRLGAVSTASLRQEPGEKTLGSVVLMTPQLVDRLSVFEGYPNTYKMEVVDVSLVGRQGQMSPSFPALTYTRVHTEETRHGPAEAYKCACLRTVKQMFPESPSTVRVFNGNGQLKDEWQHPGFAKLSLPAFLYEVGARKSPPWIMPRTVTEVVEKLEAVGCRTLEMKPRKFVDDINAINRKLQDAGKSVIGDQVLHIAHELLAQQGYAV